MTGPVSFGPDTPIGGSLPIYRYDSSGLLPTGPGGGRIRFDQADPNVNHALITSVYVGMTDANGNNLYALWRAMSEADPFSMVLTTVGRQPGYLQFEQLQSFGFYGADGASWDGETWPEWLWLNVAAGMGVGDPLFFTDGAPMYVAVAGPD